MPIFADYHRTIIGYHGTRREKTLAIVSGREAFSPSRKAYDWLGHGIYFWEYALQQAWAWARRHYPGEEIAVVASMIRLGNCLDLLDPHNASDLVVLQQNFVKDTETAGKPVPRNFNSRKFLDCAVMEYAYRMYEQSRQERVESSRAVYVPSGSEKQSRLWKSSWLCHDTHVQLCIRNEACILGTWLAKPQE